MTQNDLPLAEQIDRDLQQAMRDRDEVGSTFIRFLDRYLDELRAQDNLLMLAGVDEQRIEAASLGVGVHDRRDLHEVGPRPDDVQDLHGSV